MSKRKAIFFDVDDTLYDQLEPIKKAAERLVPGITGKVTAEEIFAARQKRSNEVFEASAKGEITKEAMYIYRGQKAFEDLGYSITEEDALRFQSLYEEEQGRLVLSEEAKEVLEVLKQRGIPMGVITNGPALHQKKKTEILGLGTYMEDSMIIISGAIGITKPSEGIFRAAEKACGLKAEELLYVGDSFENDIIGADRAGWKAVWFNKRRKKHPEGSEGICREIFDLTELLEMM